MAILPNAYKIGTEYRVEDIFSVQEPLKQSLSVTAGNIYTKDANGWIIETPFTGTTTVAVDLRRGIFYALEDSRNGTAPAGERGEPDTADGHRLSSFATLTSFVILKAPADISSGRLVSVAKVNQSGTSGQQGFVAASVTADTVQDTPAGGTANDVLGRVWTVLTTRSRTDRRPKVKTAAGDLVAVRLGIR